MGSQPLCWCSNIKVTIATSSKPVRNAYQRAAGSVSGKTWTRRTSHTALAGILYESGAWNGEKASPPRRFKPLCLSLRPALVTMEILPRLTATSPSTHIRTLFHLQRYTTSFSSLTPDLHILPSTPSCSTRPASLVPPHPAFCLYLSGFPQSASSSSNIYDKYIL